MYTDNYHVEHFEYYLWKSARQRCKKNGMEFTITVEDIVIPTHCPYLGIELTKKLGVGRSWTNPSIDRINSELGYVPGNVQVISDKANRLKCHFTINELIIFAKGILKVHES